LTYYIYNSAWADELTSYNGNAISYDALETEHHITVGHTLGRADVFLQE